MQAQNQPIPSSIPHTGPVTTRFLRKAEILKATGLSDTTIWRLVKNGKFPQPYKIGPNSIAWRECDYERWATDPAAWSK